MHFLQKLLDWTHFTDFCMSQASFYWFLHWAGPEIFGTCRPQGSNEVEVQFDLEKISLAWLSLHLQKRVTPGPGPSLHKKVKPGLGPAQRERRPSLAQPESCQWKLAGPSPGPCRPQRRQTDHSSLFPLKLESGVW